MAMRTLVCQKTRVVVRGTAAFATKPAAQHEAFHERDSLKAWFERNGGQTKINGAHPHHASHRNGAQNGAVRAASAANGHTPAPNGQNGSTMQMSEEQTRWLRKFADSGPSNGHAERGGQAKNHFGVAGSTARDEWLARHGGTAESSRASPQRATSAPRPARGTLSIPEQEREEWLHKHSHSNPASLPSQALPSRHRLETREEWLARHGAHSAPLPTSTVGGPQRGGSAAVFGRTLTESEKRREEWFTRNEPSRQQGPHQSDHARQMQAWSQKYARSGPVHAAVLPSRPNNPPASVMVLPAGISQAVAVTASLSSKLLGTVRPVASHLATMCQEKAKDGARAWRNAPNDVAVGQKLQAVLREVTK